MAVVLAKKGFGYMRVSEKTCQYPGCSEKFVGVGSSKYCPEHRDLKYRKVINDHKKSLKEDDDEKNNIVPLPDLNQKINHEYTTATKMIVKCLCGEEFEITLFPGVATYPKYCTKHRNHFQLQLLIDRLSKDLNQ